ncbi:glycosyltransferase [Limnothrix sp. FACHB-881]|uniref:glycosyltransferase n=1 Tax=Limnothrix sp. FACHB-881 TaxID=2692819 RepID=UPI0018EF658F
MTSEQHPRPQTPTTIAVFYPFFAGGGAEAVTLWMLNALQADYDLTLFTLTPIDLNRLNQLYGTQLSDRVKVRYCIPAPFKNLVEFLIANSQFFRKFFCHFCIRFFKKFSRQYNLAVSGYNAIDLGCDGVQYVHWVGVLENRNFYWVSQFSEARMRRNWSIANSRMVATVTQERYGGQPVVVYPPVAVDAPTVAWPDREEAFICSGRLTKAKEPHRVLEILKRVRDQGFPIKLYFTGGGGGVYGQKYRQFLQQKIDENADWVTLYENLSYADYVNVLSRCRYGLHWKKEPFGISIAEMVKVGTIPFVRDRGGGQVEIVGEQNKELMFANDEEAVARIVALLSSSELQNRMRSALEKQAQLFSTEQFSQDIRQAIETYLKQRS